MSRSESIKKLISNALGQRTADLWSADHDIERRPVSEHTHPGQAALLLVREALSQFDLPAQLKLNYKGMKRASGHGQHHIRDGVVVVAAEFDSLSGHKHHIDVPVVVHGGYMVFPEVFVDQKGSAQVMAQSAFDEILRRGNVHTKMQDRLNMYSPHVEAVPQNEVPQVGAGMFSVSADHAPHGRDPAERDMDGRLRPGESTTLTDDVEVRLRGGSRLVYDAGTTVTIIRDMAGDGYLFYCIFPDGRRAPVRYDSLS